MHLVGKILFRRHRQPEFRYRIAALHNRRRILSGFGLCRLEHRHFARQHDRSCRRILFHPDFFCLHFILPTANAPSRRVLAGRGNGLPRFIRLLAGNAHCRTETILIGIPYQTMPIPPAYSNTIRPENQYRPNPDKINQAGRRHKKTVLRNRSTVYRDFKFYSSGRSPSVSSNFPSVMCISTPFNARIFASISSATSGFSFNQTRTLSLP